MKIKIKSDCYGSRDKLSKYDELIKFFNIKEIFETDSIYEYANIEIKSVEELLMISKLTDEPFTFEIEDYSTYKMYIELGHRY